MVDAHTTQLASEQQLDAVDSSTLSFVGQQFSALAALLAADSELVDPERVIRFAVRCVPHASDGGLTLVRGRARATTLASTNDIPAALDELQVAVGQGPCLDAARSSAIVTVPDLTTETRWPQFVERCLADYRIRSMLCVHLGVGADYHAALNFYAAVENAFDDLDIAVASIFAPYAALAVDATLQHKEVENLQTALKSNRQIAVAVGILMGEHKWTFDQAFAALRDASNHLNQKLHDVAAEVELTGALPDMPNQGAP